MESSGGSLTSSRGPPDTTVQVALRIRPQGTREKLEGSKVCTLVTPGEPQITIGNDRSFTYDHVFDTPTIQREVYERCIEKLVEGTLDGYNATVLAYGQTGSGKTHTMGTAFDTGAVDEEDLGVIPRAINHVFRRIAEMKAKAEEEGKIAPSFEVAVQFTELYNEEIKDLLDEEGLNAGNIRIHEDARGEIYMQGVTSRVVVDTLGTLEMLKGGALRRTVASTNMNEQSSRSHAIFSMLISQKRVPEGVEFNSETDMEMLSAKFHFVDLAGSERLKRTGATGERAKEGISINCGLLALGNVISALGGANGKVSHVPYRDSKLTRLLQDSLGGNSRTLMIACISPSDSDFVETLNTLKYANRAKNIKNKVVANQDKSSKLISELRLKITMLENELLEFRQGRRTIGVDGEDALNDQYHENVMLTAEVNQLRFRLKALQETNEIMRARNVDLMTAAATAKVHQSEGGGGGEGAEGGETDVVSSTIRHYAEEMERMRSSLVESNATAEALRKELARWKKGGGRPGTGGGLMESSIRANEALIEEAKRDVEKMKRSVVERSEVTSDYSPSDMAEEEESDVEGEGEMEDEEEEDNENEGERECRLIQDNLVDLQNEITIKERLIEELERSERRLSEVRVTYEKKLTELSLRIRTMEAERDRVVAEMMMKEKNGEGRKGESEAAKRVKEDYESKLGEMRREFKKLQSVEREHKRMQARQLAEQQQLKRYQAELTEMKKVKVELMKKMKEESKKAQQQRQADAKRMATYDKEQRKRDNRIKQLEMKDKQREIFVKRTTEEMNRLRREKRTPVTSGRAAPAPVGSAANRIGIKVGGRADLSKGGGKEAKAEAAAVAFSLKHARVKWTLIEKKLGRLVVQRQTVLKFEEELERNMDERRRLIDQIHLFEKKFSSTSDPSEMEVISELVDGCRQKMRYVQDQIQEIQTNLCEMDGSKDDEDEDSKDVDANVESVIERCSNLVEAKYLMQHLFNYSLEQSVSAAKNEAANKACEARIEQLVQQSYINEQLLSTVIEGDRNTASDMVDALESSHRESMKKLNRTPSIASTTADSEEGASRKLRKRASNVEELLYPSNESTTESAGGRSENSEERRERRSRHSLLVGLPIITSPFTRNSSSRSTVSGAPLRPRQLTGERRSVITTTTTVLSPNGLPRLRLTPIGEGEKNSSFIPSALFPPGTKNGTSGTNGTTRRHPLSTVRDQLAEKQWNRKEGRIVAARGDEKSGKRLTRTHTLEGHTKAILAVDSSEERLITGSKDRSAKVWDLQRSLEMYTFNQHPNNVTAVKLVPQTHLALTVSLHQVRVWDLRTSTCVRVFSSSGQVTDGDGGQVGSRQNTIPFMEQIVNAIAVDPAGKLVFTSFKDEVKVWNLEKNGCYGKLMSASHSSQSEVSCLSIAPSSSFSSGYQVLTGSRDHYVKLYEVPSDGSVMAQASVEFSPPHYDNVTAVLPLGKFIFTASKDKNIMKFNQVDMKRDHLELGAHANYIQSLTGMRLDGESKALVSACKDGTIKLWEVENTRRISLIEEINNAHGDSINELSSNSSLLFSASSDQTVGFWRAATSY